MTRETMIPVCLYFQVHQPWRLRRYNYFDVGREHRYFDDAGNRCDFAGLRPLHEDALTTRAQI